jgi:N-glycosylase/DNA lyase
MIARGFGAAAPLLLSLSLTFSVRRSLFVSSYVLPPPSIYNKVIMSRRVSSSSLSITTDDNNKRKLKEGKQSNSVKKKRKAKVKVERTHSFEPAWWGNILKDKNDDEYPPVHTLILGTHPSIASLSKNEMFGHPLNAFWYLAGDSLGFRRSAAVSPTTGKPYVYFHDHLRYDNEHILEYSQQLERLVSKGFAMWDIVAECEREGSLDQDIEQEVANPIREFCEGTLNNIDQMASVKRIIIANGSTGAKFFVKHFTQWFVDGKLCAASDDMSQRAFKSVMNKAKKAQGEVSISDGNDMIEVVVLPGVSPAAAKFTYLEKRAAWETSCYGPGLKDYETWQSNRLTEQSSHKSPVKQMMQTPKKESATARANMPRTPSSSPKGPVVRILSSDIAKLAPENDWVDLEVSPAELRPSSTLTNGQCFNWMVVDTEEKEEVTVSNGSPRQSAWGTHDAKEWIGPLENRVLSIKETPTTTLFRVIHGPLEGTKEYLKQYFRLETRLAPLYKEWSKADPRMAKIAAAIPGVRILRQSPLECMISFICSSNNNIPRITKMLSAFREQYGNFMMEIPVESSEGEGSNSISIFSFPTLTSLGNASEDDLRAMGLGYRAKFIVGTVSLLEEKGGEDFLLQLRASNDCQAVQDELIQFPGIGRKVADCIALFSLDSDEAIPVDVHVQHIASRDYDPTVLGQSKSLTPTIYQRVGDLFRERFKNRAGWAHSLLFVAELPSFRSVLPLDMVKEMDEWKKHEQQQKAKVKEEKKKQKKTEKDG